jgi:hypothetical protein
MQTNEKLKKKDSEINPLKPKVHLNNIKKGRPYLKENKPHIHYKDQPVNAV